MDVFLASPWIPPEWIRAHGLQPRGLCSAEIFPPGARPLSAGVCALANAALRFARARSDAAVVFPTTCDQLRRGFDAVLHGQPGAFLFNLPATWQSDAAPQIFRAELERLGNSFSPSAAARRRRSCWGGKCRGPAQRGGACSNPPRPVARAPSPKRSRASIGTAPFHRRRP